MAYAFRGLEDTNEASFLVAEYLQIKALAKLGFQFNGDHLNEFKAEIYSMISREIADLEHKEMKKNAKKRR